MSEERHKRGWVYWCAVALIVVVLYPLFTGVSLWLVHRGTAPEWILYTTPYGYHPLQRGRFDTPKATSSNYCMLMEWYRSHWRSRRDVPEPVAVY